MKIINCANCDMSFDLHSREKRNAGGKANECVDCSEETVVKYAGVAAGEGKLPTSVSLSSSLLRTVRIIFLIGRLTAVYTKENRVTCRVA